MNVLHWFSIVLFLTSHTAMASEEEETENIMSAKITSEEGKTPPSPE